MKIQEDICGNRSRKCAFFSTSSLRKKDGFSIIETLIMMGLLSVVALGTIKLSTVSIQSSQVVRSAFSEQELRIAVNNVLTNDNDCKANLQPTTGKLTGGNSQKGIGTISKLEKGGVVLLESGESFKGNLEIVKMELTGDASQDPKADTVDRTFVVYYSRKNAKELNTLGGGYLYQHGHRVDVILWNVT